MAKLLFKLRGVPDDELRDILEILESKRLSTYETSGGIWGFSFPGLWLEDESRFVEARELIDEYQQARQERLRAEWQAQKDAGSQPTIMQTMINKPVTTLGLIVFCVAIVYFSITPFLDFLSPANNN